MSIPSEKGDKEVSARRGFLKSALISAGAVGSFLGAVKFDSKDGIRIGNTTVSLGMAEAQAVCGAVGSCSGGGGQCGAVGSCGGGGGVCGAVGSCSGDGGSSGGGGGQCGAVGSCGGGGGQCGAVGSCSGGGGVCGAVGTCGGR